jgi:hypothetical protein
MAVSVYPGDGISSATSVDDLFNQVTAGFAAQEAGMQQAAADALANGQVLDVYEWSPKGYLTLNTVNQTIVTAAIDDPGMYQLTLNLWNQVIEPYLTPGSTAYLFSGPGEGWSDQVDPMSAIPDQEYLAEQAILATTTPPPSVVGSYIFYAGSSFDGSEAAPNVNDDNAIATDKTPLLPGQTATFANYTSYSDGINGIMVDIADAPPTTLSLSDFSFAVGNNGTPSSWTTAPAPTSMVVTPGGGVNGAERIEFVWANNAIENEWLQVTVDADSDTGLASPDIFYYGNSIGSTGAANPTSGRVTPADVTAVESNVGPGAVGITNPYDFTRAGRVTPADVTIAESSVAPSGLQLISPPAAPAVVSAALPSVQPATTLATTPTATPAAVTPPTTPVVTPVVVTPPATPVVTPVVLTPPVPPVVTPVVVTPPTTPVVTTVVPTPPTTPVIAPVVLKPPVTPISAPVVLKLPAKPVVTPVVLKASAKPVVTPVVTVPPDRTPVTPSTVAVFWPTSIKWLGGNISDAAPGLLTPPDAPVWEARH